jgi:hypothetical protein
MGFATFAKFVCCFDPLKMMALIDYLFDTKNLHSFLKSGWSKILDESFVKERIIDPMSHYESNAVNLQETLYKKAKYGIEIHKTNVKTNRLK